MSTSESRVRDLSHAAFSDLNTFWDNMDVLESELTSFSESSLDFVAEPIERCLEKLRAFEPSISVIGQIKAGKSTLMNAMIGQTDLLPSDVNPWTSVITGVHINSRRRPPNCAALFRFFDAAEWDRLVETGGRLGEMAERAGFGGEADEVRAQVEEMRQTTEARLGEEFQQLLGSSRAFPELKKEIIDSYICYGDPEDIEDGLTEGVYADITKTADLFVDIEGYPKGLCLRDTPGVNDTFMMREQITLNAISESRVCVVVLSAHQALSTMDLALLRIICAIEAREVIIFVNRIDELQDTAAECERIRTSITKTLGRVGLDTGITILFGSGYWANCAVSDRCDQMMPTSRAALSGMSFGADLSDPADLREAAMRASGVPDLLRALAERVANGPGAAMLRDLHNDFAQIQQMNATVTETAGSEFAGERFDIDPAAIRSKLDFTRMTAMAEFRSSAAEVRADLKQRLTEAQETFVNSATQALQSHIDTFGEFNSWSHDATALRMMLKTLFTKATDKLRRVRNGVMEQAQDNLQQIIEYDLEVFQDMGDVEFPEEPAHRAPTSIAKTMSFDLQGPWWRKFWKFGGKDTAEKRYRNLIIDETAPLIDELLTDFFDPAVETTCDTVADFLNDQIAFVDAVTECLVNGAPAPTRAKPNKTAA